MIVHTSAIVFKSVDYQETSKIVTLFTEEHGKMAVIVRGAKRPKSKFGGLIETGNLLDVVYYHKPTRSVQVLSEASLLEKTLNIRTEFEKMALATSAIELIGQLLHEEEVNVPVFNFTCNFLLWLDQADGPVRNIFPYLQIRLAGLMGLDLQLSLDSETRNNDFYLNLESGTISTNNHSTYSYKLSQNQFKYVKLAMQTRNSKFLDIEFNPGELKTLIDYMDRYFKYHIEGVRDRKSDAIFEQMLQD